jgi:hyperosmotically inducible periplasmic protein
LTRNRIVVATPALARANSIELRCEGAARMDRPVNMTDAPVNSNELLQASKQTAPSETAREAQLARTHAHIPAWLVLCITAIHRTFLGEFMKTQMLLLALAAAACGETGNPPAQTPATSFTGVAASDIPAATSEVPKVAVATSVPATAWAVTDRKSADGTGPNASNGSSGSNGPSAPKTAPVAPNEVGHVDPVKDADNSKINERDRSGATLTPMDQGNSTSETKISAAIRRGIMGDKSLSFTAKNVKVITVGTKVTLRGPVKTERERATIAMLAKQAAGVTDVDNQLEISK